jgi:hypothetical protein
MTRNHAVLNLQIYDSDSRGWQEAYKQMPFYSVPAEFVHHTSTHLNRLSYTPDNITYTCHIIP